MEPLAGQARRATHCGWTANRYARGIGRGRSRRGARRRSSRPTRSPCGVWPIAWVSGQTGEVEPARHVARQPDALEQLDGGAELTRRKEDARPRIASRAFAVPGRGQPRHDMVSARLDGDWGAGRRFQSLPDRSRVGLTGLGRAQRVAQHLVFGGADRRQSLALSGPRLVMMLSMPAVKPARLLSSAGLFRKIPTMPHIGIRPFA